ncbi:MAG TPA: transglutaminase-like domain-containing protein [Steroidobacteraceae bacterium]|nr:transglutaminase-like domain-containing protein [Steroidobacteraceae bacterium]
MFTLAWISGGLSLCLFVMTAVAAPAETRWQRVMDGDRKVGVVEHSRRVEADRVFESERLTLELGKAGRRVTYTVTLDTESTADGSLVRVIRDAETREGHSRVEARVVGADLVVDIGAGKQRQSHLLAGAGANLKAEEYSRRWRQAVGSGALPEPLEFRAFDASKAAVADLELSRVPASQGFPRIQRLIHTGNEVNAKLQALDPNGDVVEEALRLGGLRLSLLGATEAEARAPNQVLDHVVGQFQKSPYRIPASGLRAKLRYGFDNGGRAPQIPVGGGQRSWTDGPTTWIQVCADCAPDETGLSDAERASALRATPWLNFTDASLAGRVRRVVAGSTTPAVIMRRLTAYVREHMSVEQIDMLGYGSALEAFQSRRGDCTEYAVLLAAMGRAAGIPTRVISGLVYARSFEGQRYVFVPHAWVHAWTGASWQSFDAALGSFDSTHLAFASSDDGNPAELLAGLNLAHALELTSAARVLPRKTAAK